MKNKIITFSHFKGGIIKKCFGVGLDAGVLIALITNPIKSKEILLEDFQEQKDLLYTHPIAFQEARRRLHRGFEYSWEESLKVLKNLKKEFNIKEVLLIKNNPKLKELDKLCEKDNCDAGDNIPGSVLLCYPTENTNTGSLCKFSPYANHNLIGC